jgi:hypothetical protein
MFILQVKGNQTFKWRQISAMHSVLFLVTEKQIVSIKLYSFLKEVLHIFCFLWVYDTIEICIILEVYILMELVCPGIMFVHWFSCVCTLLTSGIFCHVGECTQCNRQALYHSATFPALCIDVLSHNLAKYDYSKFICSFCLIFNIQSYHL